MNKLPEYWCVRSNYSQLFKDTVIRYINSKYSKTYIGDANEWLYGYDGSGEFIYKK